MLLDRFLTDTVSLVKPSGERVAGVKANVQPNVILISDGSLPIEEGDMIERVLPNGMTERYTVRDRGYFAAFGRNKAHYQVQVDKAMAREARHGGTTIYNVSGPHARVNVQSTDTSTNVVNVNTTELFAQLAGALVASVADMKERTDLVARVSTLERTCGSPGYLSAYQKFIAAAANHMTVIAPFLPALAQLGQ